MTPAVETRPSDWSDTETWWDSYVRGHEIALIEDSLPKELEDDWAVRDIQQIDDWWDSYIQDQELALAEHSLPKELEDDWATEGIREMDIWWGSYTEVLQEELAELQDVFGEADRYWEENDSVFDADPLSDSWASRSGPLRANQEENWSHWLAHLIRSSAGDFVVELFGDEFDEDLRRVSREVHFHDEELHDRRADILVEFRNLGISIEVKKGDENYGKTAQTARLVEEKDHRRRNWKHLLLLPKHKSRRLKRSLGDTLVDDDKEGRPRIESDEHVDVGVIYWRDVSRALRRTLSSGEKESESGENWESSAYTFISLIERNICDFYSRSFLEDRVRSLRVSDLSGIGSMKPDDQLRYFESVHKEETHE